MLAKKYPYNTMRTYGYTIKKIFRENQFLNRNVVNKLLKEFKHQNQRAVLILINRYCYDNNIDFRMIIPSMVRQKNKITIKTMPVSEIDIMINSAPKPYDLMLKCIFKIGGGLRISEAIKLTWNNFKWAVWLNNMEDVGAVEIRDSKSDARLITVPKELMKEIYEYAKEKRVLNEFGIPIGGVLFSFNKCYKGEYKKELRENNLEKWKVLYVQHSYNWFRYHILIQCCEKALGHPIRIHSLRHTRATQLYDEKGVPIEIIQRLLGHKELKTTMIYTQISNKNVYNAMKDVD